MAIPEADNGGEISMTRIEIIITIIAVGGLIAAIVYTIITVF